MKTFAGSLVVAVAVLGLSAEGMRLSRTRACRAATLPLFAFTLVLLLAGSLPSAAGVHDTVERAASAATTRKVSGHFIGVRVVGGSGELYDRRSGKRFVPRGANYVRLAVEGHSTLNVGRYSGSRAGKALARMRALGFNAVRVFVEGSCTSRCAA